MAPILLYGTGCSNDSNLATAPDSGTITGGGTLKLYLTDAPAVFSKVDITFTEISVKVKDDTEDTWITVSDQEQTFDLLSLTGGLTALLGEETLEPGEYGQIRLLITAAEVFIVEGEGDDAIDVRYTLQIPSGSASGLKIGKGFTIEEGELLELVIDFDAARSIHKLGNNDVYQLKPVLRLVAAEQSGAITGTVTPLTSGLTAYAYADLDSEPVASTAVDETTGEFTLAFLPAGSYTVTITDSEGNVLELYPKPDAVEVNIGQTTSLELTIVDGS